MTVIVALQINGSFIGHNGPVEIRAIFATAGQIGVDMDTILSDLKSGIAEVSYASEPIQTERGNGTHPKSRNPCPKPPIAELTLEKIGLRETLRLRKEEILRADRFGPDRHPRSHSRKTRNWVRQKSTHYSDWLPK